MTGGNRRSNMGKKLLSAAEVKNNRKLRDLIKEFMESDSEVPEEVFGFLKRMKNRCRLLAPVDISDEDLKKYNDDNDEDLTFDVDMKLIEDEDEHTWIPLFTSEEAAAEGDEDDDEKPVYLPFFIGDVLQQIEDSDEIDGAVIDPWTDGFPIPAELADEFSDDDDDDEDGEYVGINLVKGSIVDVECDAIVNSANNTLIPGAGGVDKDIHDAAGEGLAAECRTLHGCRTGEAKITDAYDLGCDYVIHTVGPIYSGKSQDDDELGDCYESCLYMAREHGLHSIAFPCISTGYFGFPKEEACDIAVQAVLGWLGDNDDYRIGITFCCKDGENYDIYQKYLDDELGEDDE